MCIPRSKGKSPKESRRLGLAAGSLVIDLAQPRARLAAARLEPDPEIPHLYFYDISAWSLPLAFGLSPSWASVVNAKRQTGWPPENWHQNAQNFTDFESLAYILDAAESQLPRFANAAMSFSKGQSATSSGV